MRKESSCWRNGDSISYNRRQRETKKLRKPTSSMKVPCKLNGKIGGKIKLKHCRKGVDVEFNIIVMKRSRDGRTFFPFS